MKKNHPFFIVQLIFTILVACSLPIEKAEAARENAARPWQDSSILRDPEWQKSFLGSYGFLSGAEPEIRNSEIEVLREVIDLMKVNPRAAASVLEKRVGTESSAALDFILANLRFQNGDLTKAREGYGRALEKFPDFRRAEKNLGLLLVQDNEFAEAIEHLSRALELGDRDGRTYGLLGYCHVNQQNYLAAEAAYRQAVLQEPEGKDWQLGLARALLAEERYGEVVSLFSAYLERQPTDANAWKLQANAYLGLDRPRAAAVNLEAVRLLGKEDTVSLVLLGDIYMNEGISDLAKEAYLGVIEADESGRQYKAAYRAAGLLLRSQAYPETAEVLASIDRRYEKQLSNDDELDLMTLKAKLARAQGRNSDAATLLETVVSKDGTRGTALLELAKYHFDRSNDAKALLLLERAQNLEAFERQALIEEAQFRVRSREYDQASALLRKAQRIKQEPRVERFLARVEDAARRQ